MFFSVKLAFILFKNAGFTCFARKQLQTRWGMKTVNFIIFNVRRFNLLKWRGSDIRSESPAVIVLLLKKQSKNFRLLSANICTTASKKVLNNTNFLNFFVFDPFFFSLISQNWFYVSCFGLLISKVGGLVHIFSSTDF